MGSLSSIPVPYLSKYLIDTVLIGERYGQIRIYIVGIIIIIGLQLIIGRVTVKISANFFQCFLADIRNEIFQNSLSVEDTDSLNTVILNDAEMYVSSVSQIISIIFTNSIAILAYMLIILKLNWKLSIIVFLFIPIYIVWIIYISSKLSKISEEQQESKDLLLKSVDNIKLNAEVIAIYKFYSKIVCSFNYLISKNKELNVKSSVYQNFVNIVAGVIITVSSIVPFVVGVYFFSSEEMTIGGLIAFNTYSGLIFSPITALISIIPTISISKVYKKRIDYFLQKENISKEELSLVSSRITLNKVNIYSDNNCILKDISLNLQSGMWVRLIGANGSGKTLLLKTIANLYNNYSGEIMFGAKENILGKLTENLVVDPSQILYVSNSQNFPLDNLLEELTEQNELETNEIEHILKVVEFSEKNSITFDNIKSIKNLSNNFSTGELQKIRLARALARKPKFLFLDEIFSNIEPAQCAKILRNIQQSFPNMSLVIVEHHFSEEKLFDVRLTIAHKTLIKS